MDALLALPHKLTQLVPYASARDSGRRWQIVAGQSDRWRTVYSTMKIWLILGSRPTSISGTSTSFATAIDRSRPRKRWTRASWTG